MELKTIEEFECFIKNDIKKNEKLIFKYSPICPISRRIEREFDEWYKNLNTDLGLIKINVIASRTLSNYIADFFNITHESPQLIWLNQKNSVKADTSHYNIDEEFLNKHL